MTAHVILDAAATALADARAASLAVQAGEVALLRAALAVVAACPPLNEADVAGERVCGGTWRPPDLDLNGEGAPEISDIAVAELALAARMSTSRARRLAGDAVELRHRLPRVWARVEAGEVEVWMARQVAQRTVTLSAPAADFVDRQLAPFAHRIPVARVDALVDEALIRHDRPEYVARAVARHDPHSFDVHLRDVTLGGTVPVTGVLDLGDAVALEQAVRATAGELSACGFSGTEGARRARAVGEIARGAVALSLGPTARESAADDRGERPSARGGPVTLDTVDGIVVAPRAPHPWSAPAASPPTSSLAAPESGAPTDRAGPRRPVATGPRRDVMLYVHVTDESLAELLRRESCAADPGSPPRNADPGLPRLADAAAPPGGASPVSTPHDVHPGTPPRDADPVPPPRDADPGLPPGDTGASAPRHGAAAASPSGEESPVPPPGETDPPPAERARPALLAPDEHVPSALLGRAENTRTPLDLAALASWCREIGTRLVVRPVLDTAASIHVDSYEIPDRLREQVVLRDGTCAFPRCDVPARSCDVDHIVPYDHTDPASGGQTETSNLAALCRTHHNLKTHRGWGYERDPQGGYRWTSPLGQRAASGRSTGALIGEMPGQPTVLAAETGTIEQAPQGSPPHG